LIDCDNCSVIIAQPCKQNGTNGPKTHCVLATDVFVNVCTVIHNKWQFRWNLYPTNKLYKIYPNVLYTS